MNPIELHADMLNLGREKARTAAYATSMDRLRKGIVFGKKLRALHAEASNRHRLVQV